MADSADTPPAETAPIVFLVAASGKVLTWSDACEQVFGYRSEQIVGRPLVQLCSPERCADIEACLGASRPSPMSFGIEFPPEEGRQFSFTLVLLPIFSGAGKLFGFAAIVSVGGPDTGIEAVSEQELIGQMPLRAMVDLLPNTFYVLNRRAQLIMWNAKVEQVTGLTHCEVAAIRAFDLFPPEERATVVQKVNEVFERGGEVLVEAGLVTKGGVIPYLFTGARFSAYGQMYLCGMGLDLSEQRRQQEMLTLRERALHASSNGIFILRFAGDAHPIEYVNPAFERITGYQCAELIGHDWQRLCAAMCASKEDDADLQQLRTAFRDKREARVTLRNQKRTGEIFWSDLTVAPVVNERGEATHLIGVIHDVTESKQRTSLLEHEINHDVLTGLANRNLLWDRLDQAIHLAQRNKTLVATVLVDLDNFKTINDTMGHEAGDDVLKTVARKMVASVRESDTVARLGGDEFVLVLANQPSLRFTLRMIERLRRDLAAPALIMGKQLVIESSMGVSIFPHDGATARELIQAADAAMYSAKAASGNDVHFFSGDVKATTEAKRAVDERLRKALASDELYLLFQPYVSLRTARIVGAEALLRWRHPERGVLLPGVFLPDAEESGLIVPVGDWVFDHLCAALQRLRDAGFPGLVLSMNLSYKEIAEKHLIARLRDGLAAKGVAPASFGIEVSEATLLRDPGLTQGFLASVAPSGIHLTVDEFGAGMFTLTKLQHPPITNLKVSRAHIDGISGDKSGNMRTRTIIRLGHLMHVKVIGEGVETRVQRDFLKVNGCDQMQGNFFSAPVSIEGLEHMLTLQRAPPG